VAKLLFVAKRARPDILLAVSFLTTRVKEPDYDDWKKLIRLLGYLRGSEDLLLNLSCTELKNLTWYIDGSYATHEDMKRQSGAILLAEECAVLFKSNKQKVNMRSSTKSELIVVDDTVQWTKNFMMEDLPHLALAPAGVVPQRERRPRPIMDYSFNNINHESVQLAPYLAMQFGQAFQRIIQRVVYANPAHGPVLLAKLDLADGYYRIPLSPHAAQHLAVVLPPDSDGQVRENLVGIPLSLPMGWSLSPPYFCAFTETCADIANSSLAVGQCLPLNPTEPLTQLHPLPLATTNFSQHPWQPAPPLLPLAHVDVYIDDFLLAAQRGTIAPTLRAALHAISTVFPDDASSPRRAVVSASKLAKGDATWATTKRVLGWDIDTEKLTIHLPEHRLQRLDTLLSPLRSQKRVSWRKWQVLLGELRSMVPAIHSSKYYFSILQNAMSDQQRPRIRLSKLVHSVLATWQAMARSITKQPAPLTMLVPTAPMAIGASDASGDGMVGVLARDGPSPHTVPPHCLASEFSRSRQTPPRIYVEPHGRYLQ